MTEIDDSIQIAISRYDIQHGNVGFLDNSESSIVFINWKRALDHCKIFSSFWEKLNDDAYRSSVEELMQN